MLKSNEEMKKLIIFRGEKSEEENLRIFNKFFKNRQLEQGYIYKKFQINFKWKILDVGCGYGHDLIHFAQDSLGLEAGEAKVNFARSIGLNVMLGNAENDLTAINQEFDLIWCLDFLVHMASPYKFLYDCRRLLKPRGKIVVQVPLMSMFNMHRSHYHFYALNKKSLEYLLEMAGYKVIKTSGLIRKKPRWFNLMFDYWLERWGGNIWILAEKSEQVPVDFNNMYLPEWFKVTGPNTK
jgi:2-polyprenyl-3-methyl-5-hydroxy-6-metoxy-1,4-benzoquinol methylase